jgi:mannose-6-phosphate isomerase-like protein (cupin superfamily)
MDRLERGILRELLAAEKEVTSRTAKRETHDKDSAGQLDHWSAAVLLERGAYLRELAKYGDGQASETLNRYPRHATMLSFRARDGAAELHENSADIFCVLDGRATLLTGGKIIGANTVGPGEIRGERIEGGKRQELRAGDVAHVPAGVPHQMLVAGDRTFTSFVVKICETP